MKNIKSLFALLVLGSVLSTGAFAQDGTADVTVNAQLVAALTVTNTTEVTFGGITQGSAVTATIQANGNDPSPDANLGAGAGAGLVTITGTSGASITISHDGTAVLGEVSDTDDLTFTASVWNGATEILSGGTAVTLTGGSITLDIGGDLDVEAADIAGIYATDIGTAGDPLTVNVNYD